ncbi:MAG: Rrf2 family transcriptional regulator [Candidatus Binatia bacterium]
MAFLQVSRKVDYALRAVIHLANEEGTDRVCSVAEISAREGIPRQFLEKIIQQLIHKGVVRSRRGAHGGYVLARSAEQVTFRDVIEAVEGPISLNVCVGEHPDCHALAACGMNRVWLEGQRRVMDLFEKTTIAEVRHPLGFAVFPGPEYPPAAGVQLAQKVEP